MLADTIKKASDTQSIQLRKVIILKSKDEYTNEEATRLLEQSMKESYLSSLEMIQAFSFGDWKQAESALNVPDDKDMGQILGALLGHTRSIFEYVSEHTGMSPKEVMRGYGYYFYSNVLTDLEDMFSATTNYLNEMDMFDDMINEPEEGDNDDNDKSA